MNIRLRRFALGLLLLAPYAAPMAADDNLSGTYKVRGECAYRAQNGEYETCVAWNELKLKQLKKTNEYEFNLETNTFATTQGSCSFSGKFRIERKNAHIYLARSDELEDGCHLQFRVTPRNFVLEVPESEMSTTCKVSCGFNSSLYSAPFPRRSKRK